MKSKILGLLAVGLLAGPMGAVAGQITFENYTGLGYAVGTTQTLVNLGPGQLFSMTAVAGQYEVTTSNELNLKDFIGSDAERTVQFARTDGGTFDFLGYDLNRSGIYGSLLFTSDRGGSFSCEGSLFCAGATLPGSGWQGLSWLRVSSSTLGGEAKFRSFSVNPTSVPEPGTLALLGLGLAGLGLSRRRKAV